MKDFARRHRMAGKRLGLVGTMGAVHAGHLSLVHRAAELCDIVICMIYINPAQFTVNEDFDSYPRSMTADALQMQQAGAHAVFAPKTFYHVIEDSAADAAAAAAADKAQVVGQEQQLHPLAHETWVTVERMQQGLCGQSRPHLFRGIATICIKMYNTMMPDVFVLGQKDYQQNRVVERLTRDLDFDVEVVEAPTVREADGLAMSSRNVNLTPEARAQAPAIYAALSWAQQAAQQRQVTSATDLVAEVTARIAAAGGRVDYVEARHAEHLEVVQGDVTVQPTVIAVAVNYEGKRGKDVRLTDNIVIR